MALSYRLLDLLISLAVPVGVIVAILLLHNYNRYCMIIQFRETADTRE